MKKKHPKNRQHTNIIKKKLRKTNSIQRQTNHLTGSKDAELALTTDIYLWPATKQSVTHPDCQVIFGRSHNLKIVLSK